MPKLPTAEDVLAAARARANRRYETLREERYQLANHARTAGADPDRIAELRMLMDMHETAMYRALNDTSISVTLLGRPRSDRYVDSILQHILAVDLTECGYPTGTRATITAHTTHTYVLEWTTP